MAVKKYKESDEEHYYFKVTKEEYLKLTAYSKFIKKNLKSRNRIPLRVFKKYESFYLSIRDDKAKYYDQQIEYSC